MTSNKWILRRKKINKTFGHLSHDNWISSPKRPELISRKNCPFSDSCIVLKFFPWKLLESDELLQHSDPFILKVKMREELFHLKINQARINFQKLP